MKQRSGVAIDSKGDIAIENAADKSDVAITKNLSKCASQSQSRGSKGREQQSRKP